MYTPNYGICSTATFGEYQGIASKLATAEECCAKCAATPSCKAFNFCKPDAERGCRLPPGNKLAITEAGNCLMYMDVESQLAWSKDIMHGCGNPPDLATGYLP